jgi:glycosyltransferase involved in cell wall biosynthesis
LVADESSTTLRHSDWLVLTISGVEQRNLLAVESTPASLWKRQAILIERYNMTTLTIVVPCHNEAAVLPEISRQLLSLLDNLHEQGKISADSRVAFVDDGSRDDTWNLIEEFSAREPRLQGTKLSRNYGHQNALLAGLMTVEGDVVVSIDADLQDDLSVIGKMIDAHEEGADIVYGVRSARDVDTPFKRLSAVMYYKLLNWMGVDVVFNHADYRLLSRRALEALKEYSEVNLFLRGLVPTLGFQSSIVSYERHGRYAGESKYPLHKMLGLAIDGVTSFSAFPLRLIAGLGVIVFLASMGLSIWVLWTRLFTDNAIPGWASSVLPMYLLGGIQLFSIGILGEYISKVYLETKRRPRYIIEKSV